LLSTHIVSDIENIAGTILVMKDGQLLQKGSMEEIIQVIEGKVWECSVDNKLADRLAASCPVVNIRQENGYVFLRLISDQAPCENATSVVATLEDLFLYYFREVGSE
jgi:ABC-2 type transport system ATP-binding protein